MPSDGRAAWKNACPFACDAFSELSRLRTGLGGGSTCNWKSAKLCISACEGAVGLPIRL